MLFVRIVFVLQIFEVFCSTDFFEEDRFWVDRNPSYVDKTVGRPAKVIIDEIITRSVTYPAAKSRSNHSPFTYEQTDQLLTPNRRRDETTDNSGNIQMEEDDVIVVEGDESTLTPLEKTLQLIAETPNSDDGGIHIHVQEKALNAIFEKIPWEDLLDSFNNKLTHKHEIRQVREHIFSNADQKVSFDHSRWGQQGQYGQNAQDQLRHTQHAQEQPRPSLNVDEYRNYKASKRNTGSYPNGYSQRSTARQSYQPHQGYSHRKTDEWPKKPKPVYCTQSYSYQNSRYPIYNHRRLKEC